MKTTKRQTFYLDGNVYAYRITKSAILRYEQASGRKITLAMTLTQIVRALYYVTCMHPYGVTEQYMVDAYRKGNLRTRKNAESIPSAAFAHSSSMHAENSSACPYSTTEHKK